MAERAMILSMKAVYAEMIFSGEKIMEVRRRTPRCAIPTRCFLWACRVGLVGEATIVNRIICQPDNLPILNTGLTSAEYFAYLSGNKKAVLLYLDNPVRWTRAMSLSDLRDIGLSPPQSWRYLVAETAETVRRKGRKNGIRAGKGSI